MSSSTVAVILDLISAVGRAIFDAFKNSDLDKLEKVTDVLGDDHSTLKLKVRQALEREKARQEFEDAKKSD